MEIKFFGTRGSIPTPGQSTVYFGGNTACTCVYDGPNSLILDAGTGIRELGHQLDDDMNPVHLLISHHHWDHIQGFPFFAPIYQPGRTVNIYVPETSPQHMNAILDQMSQSYFPVSYRDLESDIKLIPLRLGTQLINHFEVTCVPLNHPNGGFGFIIKSHDKSVAYLTDNELYSSAHQHTTPKEWAHLIKQIDCLIHDAQYTDDIIKSRIDWGHSSVSQTIELAVEAQVKKLFLYSHDPNQDDEKIHALTKHFQQLHPYLNFEFAREGARYSV